MRRFLRAIVRWLTAIKNLGILSTLEMVFLRLLKPNKEVTTRSKKLGKFKWNAKSDWVISHFYTPQIKINTANHSSDISIIFDLGANIGTESIRFSSMYPHAKIFSIEANHDNFLKLQFNTKEIKNIEPIHAAIWSSNKNLSITNNCFDNQSWKVKEAENDPIIIGTKLIDLMATYDIEYIDILKVDIEGSERELFGESASEWIHKIRCIIVEVPDNDSPGTTQMIFNLLQENNIEVNTFISGENLVLVRSNLEWKPTQIEEF